MNKLDETIKNISYNQHEILFNIMQMHNGGNPFECDPTYSIGNFYGDFKMKKSDGTEIPFTIPQPKYKFDVCPQAEGVEKIDPLGRLPLDDNSVSSINFDPPFCVSVGKSMKQDPRHTEVDDKPNRCIITNRFDGYYPRFDMYASYSHWLTEALRVLKPDGIMVFKCQATITGGLYAVTDCYTWFEATRIGFYTLDRFILLAKGRLIGRMHKQEHARNFTSTFWVFQKPGRKSKKLEDYYRWMVDGEEKFTLQRIMNAGLKPDYKSLIKNDSRREDT